ncbi:pyridoxamine 5'-phosphate oxidase family protein [Streptomyces sp. NPDC059866]|uniref:pyridoxamine 5'-phosphate oxidase family protein n=1 Tax=Streptomyces sp. NPDC059866 TaxID=3346978 RepID=UPI003662C5EC
MPVTFAVLDDVVYFAVDHKLKNTWDLRRLRNIRENPSVTVLVDHYDEDWSTLWWARADGRGEVLEDGRERLSAVERLGGSFTECRFMSGELPSGHVTFASRVRHIAAVSTRPPHSFITSLSTPITSP